MQLWDKVRFYNINCHLWDIKSQLQKKYSCNFIYFDSKAEKRPPYFYIVSFKSALSSSISPALITSYLQYFQHFYSHPAITGNL